MKKSSNAITTVVLPLIVMLFWGSLFPFIKIGYKVFNINTENIAEILIFASLRFIVCGMIVCLFAYFFKLKIEKPKRKSIFNICLMGVFAIVLHYGFTYVGLSMTDSSETAILKQFAPLLFACFSFLFVKDEKFSVTKIMGALIGFCGIIAINTGSSSSGFSLGDILILSASVCTVVSMVISAKSSKGNSPFWITGISQLFGGVVLFIIASAAGGKIPVFTFKAVLVFAYICAASIIGYTLFYYVQRTAELSKLFIIKFAEPLFACVFSAILLGEDIFKLQFLAAIILIFTGIILGNVQRNNKNQSS